jgi:cytochrome c-type biogenesis protein CcmE
MDPARKRRIRLVVALSAALILAGALAYTSFSASSSAVTPSELVASGAAGQTYQLTGKVVDGSIERSRDGMAFRVRDRDGTTSVPVTYTGTVPDPFREGREIIIDVRQAGGVWVGTKDTLITKCPSKFEEKQQQEPSGTMPT